MTGLQEMIVWLCFIASLTVIGVVWAAVAHARFKSDDKKQDNDARLNY